MSSSDKVLNMYSTFMKQMSAMVGGLNIPMPYNVSNLFEQKDQYVYEVGEILDYLISLPTINYYNDFCKSTDTMEFIYPKGVVHKISFVGWQLKFEDGLVFFCLTDKHGNVFNEELIMEGKLIEGH